jgi:hypothetical protein
MFDEHWIMTIIFDPARVAVDWVADEYTEELTSEDPRANITLTMGLGH